MATMYEYTDDELNELTFKIVCKKLKGFENEEFFPVGDHPSSDEDLRFLAEEFGISTERTARGTWRATKGIMSVLDKNQARAICRCVIWWDDFKNA